MLIKLTNMNGSISNLLCDTQSVLSHSRLGSPRNRSWVAFILRPHCTWLKLNHVGRMALLPHFTKRKLRFLLTGLGKAKDPTLTSVPEVRFTPSFCSFLPSPVHPLFGKHHAQGQGRILIWKLLRLHQGAQCGPANRGQLITGIMQRPG